MNIASEINRIISFSHVHAFAEVAGDIRDVILVTKEMERSADNGKSYVGRGKGYLELSFPVKADLETSWKTITQKHNVVVSIFSYQDDENDDGLSRICEISNGQVRF